MNQRRIFKEIILGPRLFVEYIYRNIFLEELHPWEKINTKTEFCKERLQNDLKKNIEFYRRILIGHRRTAL